METMVHWLQEHLLSCPVKAFVGVECPGCGFQRAFLALLQGDLGECWHQYPPLIPFLLTIVLLALALRTQLRYRMPALAVSVATTCIFIFVNFAFKVYA
jgi:hypothetical protein